MSESMAVPGCRSPFDASTTLLTFQSLTLPCMHLCEGLHPCNPRAWLQSLWVAALTLRGCNPHGQLCWDGHGQVPGDRLQRLGRQCRGTAPHLSHKAARHHPASPLGLRQPRDLCTGAGAVPQLSSPHGNSLSPPPLLTHPGGFTPAPMPVNGQATACRISPAFSCWWVPVRSCPTTAPEGVGAAIPERRPQGKPARGVLWQMERQRGLPQGHCSTPLRRAIALTLLKGNLLKGNRSGRTHPTAASKQRWNCRHHKKAGSPH